MAKTILTKEEVDRIAATCYLAIWQIGEFSTAKEGFEDLSDKPFKDILKVIDYPLEPVYDNEAEPYIVWQSEEFEAKSSGSNVYQGIPSLFGELPEDEDGGQ